MKPLSFHERLFFVQCLLALCVAAVLVVVVKQNINTVQVEGVKASVISQAQLIASNHSLQDAVKAKDIGQINRIMEDVSVPPNTDYIVIADHDGIRLYHSAGRGLGRPIPRSELQEVFAGNEISLIDDGLLGIATIKSRIPIFEGNEVIGLVAVGISYEKATGDLMRYLLLTILIAAVIFLLLVIWNRLFVNYIRRKMCHQSPRQIEMAFKLRKAILNSVYEGVVAVDHQNRIMVINDTAIRLLNLPGVRDTLHATPVSELFYPADFFLAANNREIAGETISCNGETLIASRSLIYDEQGQHLGAVVSFRLRQEREALEQTINAVVQDKENLRALSHEFSNKLSVIYGLMEMQQYQRAMDYISDEYHCKQSEVYQVSEAFATSTLAGLVLSKMSKARELGITFELDPLCHIGRRGLPVTENELTCIIGNLINNAFEAIVRAKPEQRVVTLFASDEGKELIIEVADSGGGISSNDINQIFEKGHTVKNEPNHGVGLSLVREIVDQANGSILVDDSEFGGALFSLFIPLRQVVEKT